MASDHSRCPRSVTQPGNFLCHVQKCRPPLPRVTATFMKMPICVSWTQRTFHGWWILPLGSVTQMISMQRFSYNSAGKSKKQMPCRMQASNPVKTDLVHFCLVSVLLVNVVFESPPPTHSHLTDAAGLSRIPGAWEPFFLFGPDCDTVKSILTILRP